MSQVGEFAFVIITFAVKLNLLDLEISSQMISVVAISMMITPFLLLLNERVIAPNFNVKFEEPASDLVSEPIKQKNNYCRFWAFREYRRSFTKGEWYKSHGLG